ncbi:MAG TPA: hypothetical protein IGS17_00575 [Oscillatoriales cyanobacterium M59_W2019_021]|nr:hypothetical protein [Oscillatoriales cyanobacterium M4454_W2019_049]HIK49411.1 hypothetical protein [Oscillatoriales cyanobacterium M59_W2019_021]
MTVASDITKELRSAISEVNYWFESESESPFRIARSRNANITPDRIKSLDLGMRRTMAVGGSYTLPDRDTVVLTQKDLTVFHAEIDSFVALIAETHQGIAAGTHSYLQLESATETLEFNVEVYNLLNALEDLTINYVDYPDDPYVGLIIIGLADSIDRNGAPTKEAIIMRSLLTQT